MDRFIHLSQKNILFFYLVIFGLLSLFYLPYLGKLNYHQEESRRVLIAETMIFSGDFLAPKYQSEIYLRKPPLYNIYLTLFSFGDGKVSPFYARFASVLALFLIFVFLHYFFRNQFSPATHLFIAASILFTPHLASKAALAEIEILFTLFVTLSIWHWYFLFSKGKKNIQLWIFPSLWCGLAFLTKALPATLFFYLSIIPYLIYKKKAKELLSLGHIVGLLLNIGLSSIWIIALLSEISIENLIQVMNHEAVSRGMHGDFLKHIVHFVTYPISVFAAIIPFSLFLFFLFDKTVRRNVIEKRKDLFLFCLLALIFNFPIYMIKFSAVRYFMPMYSCIVILSALVFESLLQNNFLQRYKILQRYQIFSTGRIKRVFGYLLISSMAICFAPYITELPFLKYDIKPVVEFYSFILVWIGLVLTFFFVINVVENRASLLVILIVLSLFSIRTVYYSISYPVKIAEQEQNLRQ